MEVPKELTTYSSVISWDSIQIAFLYAALNDLDVLSEDDVHNAFLNAPTKEKLYMMATSLDFWLNNVSHPVLIIHALYGLHSLGAQEWRDHMASTLQDGGYMSCKANPYV
jgi:hypothetical protein